MLCGHVRGASVAKKDGNHDGDDDDKDDRIFNIHLKFNIEIIPPQKNSWSTFHIWKLPLFHSVIGTCKREPGMGFTYENLIGKTKLVQEVRNKAKQRVTVWKSKSMKDYYMNVYKVWNNECVKECLNVWKSVWTCARMKVKERNCESDCFIPLHYKTLWLWW